MNEKTFDAIMFLSYSFGAILITLSFIWLGHGIIALILYVAMVGLWNLMAIHKELGNIRRVMENK